MKICGSLLWVVALVLAGCGDVYPETSRTRQAGLIIEFTPACAEGQITLSGGIINSTKEPISIESGSFPWQYDPLGTDFQAESGGVKLDKNEVTPVIGKTGPKRLMPNERRQGAAPIEFIFPALKNLLSKQPVTISYTFALRLNSQDPNDHVHGKIEIVSDPCSP